MGQNVILTGMVLNVMPIGDYDKRITILTKERGKVTAFVRGARRPNSPLLAATNPFSFGEFETYEGRSSYTITKGTIQNYFRELAEDFQTAYYGFYFLEVADYYCQENADEREMLKLLYQSLRALESPAFDNRLVKVIFEWKAMAINGEGPNVFSCMNCRKKEGLRYFSIPRGGMLCEECGKKEAGIHMMESTSYAIQFILCTKVEKLYSFSVKEDVLAELRRIGKSYMERYLPHEFQSLKILEEAEGMLGNLNQTDKDQKSRQDSGM